MSVGLPIVNRPDERLPSQRLPQADALPFQELSGLAVTQINGKDYALVPVVNGAVEANLVPRTGTQLALSTLAGEAGEVATITDTPGVMVFNGTPGGARGIYADNAGRTMVITVPPSDYTGGTIDIGPDVTEIHVRYSTLPTPSIRDGSVTAVLRLNGTRRPGQRLRMFSETIVNFAPSVNGGPAVLYSNGDPGRRWTEFFLDTVGATPTYRPLLSMMVESRAASNTVYPGSVAIGDAAGAFARNSLALGAGAATNQAGEIAFGSPGYSDLRTNKIFRVGGQTTGVNGTAVLTPTGAAVSEENMFGFDLSYGASAFGLRLDIMGKRTNSAECVRFVREVVVQRTTAGVLTLLQPETPNNPSDVLSAGMTGANVALAIGSVGGGTNNSLQITVTGPNTSSTTRWSCVAYANVMGNG